jgi:hypothetical protein
VTTVPASTSPSLTEASPSVQAHLQIMQSVINRMATNSASCKAWCITLVSAILVIVADKGEPSFAYIALLPTFLFLALDAYYLALEKSFRASYNDFVKKVHAGQAVPDDLFAVQPKGSESAHQRAALASFSVWGFYGALAVFLEVARRLVLSAA